MLRSDTIKRCKVTICTAAATALLGATAYAQTNGLFVYPQKGQDSAQQEKDEFECWKWAKENSGVNPAEASQAGADRGGRAAGALGGAARGAALGAAVGAIAGDAGKGAGAGAVVGGVGGRRGAINNEKQAQAETQQTYNRAFAACMEGRGYTVK